MDWTKVSNDPNNQTAQNQVSQFLKSITLRFDGDKTNLIQSMCRSKNMLDIGAGEHDQAYFSPSWEHAIYKDSASKIVAVEIEKNLCDFYNSLGFDFRCIDATSDNNLDEKFDFVYCGDVIEHVDNPVALVRFISRHMTPESKCIITTPNPYFIKFRNTAKYKNDLYFISNLQHVSWIVPTHMLEIIRRADSNLHFSSILVPEHAYVQSASLGASLEEYFEDFIYILTKLD